MITMYQNSYRVSLRRLYIVSCLMVWNAMYVVNSFVSKHIVEVLPHVAQLPYTRGSFAN